ncbi:hypothetical protein GCM10011512_08010 [Tersicoccus solisilvae]|uniref:Histidine kinase n=1 Tax=Tersicoccus solisilvae TaxID=1882339 RepID=A0ABQ1NZ93_9MICC|nr:hypothetical protein [Tersicoccus solisilvae]GGC83641.1 hypothetical protein GCM10011512_08010 [Tersicoccus solisilvae]
MPWWFWILLWGGLLLVSAAVLALACRRMIRSGLALVRELDRAAGAMPGAPLARQDDVPSGARDLA